MQGCPINLSCSNNTEKCLLEERLNWREKYKLGMTIGGLTAVFFFFVSFILAYYLYYHQKSFNQKSNKTLQTNCSKNRIVANLQLVSTLINSTLPNQSQHNLFNTVQNKNFIQRIKEKFNRNNLPVDKNLKIISQDIKESMMKNSFRDDLGSSSGFSSIIGLSNLEPVFNVL